jgi:hypothetical protein
LFSAASIERTVLLPRTALPVKTESPPQHPFLLLSATIWRAAPTPYPAYIAAEVDYYQDKNIL